MKPGRYACCVVGGVILGCSGQEGRDLPVVANEGFPVGAPKIVEVWPNAGSVAGGYEVIIDGEGFFSYPSAPVIRFGETACSVTYVTTERLRCVVAPAAAGPVDVTVSNPNGAAQVLANGFEFVGSPVIDSFQPAEGLAQGGGSLKIVGQNLTPAVAVLLGSEPCKDVKFVSKTEILCTIPSVTLPTAWGDTPVSLSVPVTLQASESSGESAVSPTAFVYYAPGALDHTFGQDGVARIAAHPGGTNSFRDFVLQPDGKFVAVGTTAPTPSPEERDFFIARLTATGSLDAGFSGDGWGTFDFEDDEDYAVGVALSSNGDIVVGGTVRDTEGDSSQDFDMGVAVLTADGSSTRGRRVDFNGRDDGAYAVSVLNDGKILLAGYAREEKNKNRLFALARLTPDPLELDSSFGSSGRTTTDASKNGSERIRGMVVLAGGQGEGIVVAGYDIDEDGDYVGTLARYTLAGDLDSHALGSDGSADGLMTPAPGDRAMRINACTMSPNGDLYLAGTSGTSKNAGWTTVGRINAMTGAADAAFGADGWYVWKGLGAGGKYRDHGLGIVAQADNKTVTAGFVTGDDDNEDIIVLRNQEDGSPDTSFGRDGIVRLSLGEPRERCYSVLVQDDGKIVCAGWIGQCRRSWECPSDPTEAVVVRLWP